MVQTKPPLLLEKDFDTMDKKELIRALIDLAHSEGSNIKFDHQFGYDGFVDSNGEFWATDGYSVVGICSKIQSACMEELL